MRLLFHDRIKQKANIVFGLDRDKNIFIQVHSVEHLVCTFSSHNLVYSLLGLSSIREGGFGAEPLTCPNSWFPLRNDAIYAFNKRWWGNVAVPTHPFGLKFFPLWICFGAGIGMWNFPKVCKKFGRLFNVFFPARLYAHMMHTRYQPTTLKKGSDSITEYYNKARALASSLGTIGKPLSPSEFSVFLLDKLWVVGNNSHNSSWTP